MIVEAAIALHFDQSEYFLKFCIFWQEQDIFRDVKLAFFLHIIKTLKPLSEVVFQSNQTVKQAIMSQPDSVIYGKWQLFQSENFENFMSRLGVSYLVRKLGNKSTPVVTVSQGDDGLLSFKQESLVSTSEIKFKLGEQFDEKSADGRMVKYLPTI